MASIYSFQIFCASVVFFILAVATLIYFKKLNPYSISLFTGSVICALIAAYGKASDITPEFGTVESYGQFGDYIGGLLNPLLTFTTVLILLWNNNHERKEREKLKKEFDAEKILSEAKNIAEKNELKERHESESKKTSRQLELAENQFHLRQVLSALDSEVFVFEEIMKREISLGLFPDIMTSTLYSYGMKAGRHEISLGEAIELSRSNGNISQLAESLHDLFVEYIPKDSNTNWNKLLGTIEDLSNAAYQIDLLFFDLLSYSDSKTICLRWMGRAEKILTTAAQVGALSLKELDSHHNDIQRHYFEKFPEQPTPN